MNITKDLEGKTVYLRPTGNLQRGSGKNEIKKAIIIKVNRVNITYILEGYDWENKSKYKENHIDEGWNAGYDVFLSEDEIKEESYCEKLSQSISENYRYTSDYMKLTKQQLIQIANILEVELPEDK